MKKSEISENFREISEKVGIYQKLSEKVGNFREKSDKRNFCAFFFSRLTEKRYFGKKSTEKSEIFVPGYRTHAGRRHSLEVGILKRAGLWP